MKIKKLSKYFIFFIIILIGFISLNLKEILPSEIKNFIRKNILTNKFLNSKIADLEVGIIIQQKKNNQILHQIFSGGFLINKNQEKEIKFINLGENYKLHTWKLPSVQWDKFDRQQSFVIERYKKKIFLINGDGNIFYFDINNISSDEILLFNIKSNLIKIINSPEFYSDAHLSIKDAFVDEEYLYLSYAKYIKDFCYNTSVVRGKLNSKNIVFENFFSPKECIDQKNHEHGGRMKNYDKENIIMTIGAFGNFDKPQDDDSVFGKIIMINKQSRKFKIISKGHRNPQGLIYDSDAKKIIITEHGPKGGDEVNLINIFQSKEIPNYGWPISSYGYHYDGKFKKKAPLKKSHKQFGFIEPIKYYTPSIAISELSDVTDIFGNETNKRIFVSSLGYLDQKVEGDQSIHSLVLNDNFDLIHEDTMFIGERIRDLYKIKSKKIILLTLESSGSLGLLELLE